MKPLISIVICTHNRVDLLQGAIRSVLKHVDPIDEYELLVVDNNSSDATRSVVEEYASHYLHVRYILETTLGLSHARNRGWKESRGEYIGFLDDDCEVPAGWFSNAVRVATEVHPEAFGGPHRAFYKTPKPLWFKDQYGSESLSDVARPLKKNEYLYGMNMFIRRVILQDLDGFHTELGMKGDKIAYGEETYLFDRLREKMKNAVLYYDPSIFVYHLVRLEKIRIFALTKRMFIAGQYSYHVSDPTPTSRINTLKNILGIFFKLLTSAIYMFARDKTKYPYHQNYIYEVLLNYVAQLGWCSVSLFSPRKRVLDDARE